MQTIGIVMFFVVILNTVMAICGSIDDLFKLRHYAIANLLLISLSIACYMMTGGN